MKKYTKAVVTFYEDEDVDEAMTVTIYEPYVDYNGEPVGVTISSTAEDTKMMIGEEL